MKVFFQYFKNKISLLFFVFLFSAVSGFAQLKYVSIGVNGLTCSACTRSVEMSIRKLDFVQDVQMNLKNTDGKILFKTGKTVSFEKIAQAVIDAGFSVRYLKADVAFDSLTITNGFCYSFEDCFCQFVGITNQKLSGEITLTFLGKKYLPHKEYKKWENQLKPNCNSTNKQVYYVTI
ncbi:MAG TPA: heavy metal-associated domain-containing protein [Bacteroidia bacterium]|nr:heavy metal-associated domain-containing protein [Bacteroidia bacterium]